jgi:hypothetical protein
MSESIFSVKCPLGSKNLCNTVQSHFSESQLLEVLFHLSQCSVVKFVSMLGTIFDQSAYLCVHMHLSGITVLPFSCFPCVFLCIGMITYYFNIP